MDHPAADSLLANSASPSSSHLPQTPTLSSGPPTPIPKPPSTTTLTNLTVPAAQTHSTFESLLSSLQSHARACGYALVIESSRPAHGVVKLACDLHGKPRNHRKLTEAERVRKRKPSRKCDCPMRVRCWRVDAANWTFTATQPGHNHGASADPAAHVAHRKRKGTALHEVQLSVVQGQKTRDVLETLLREDKEACYSRRDIYNDRARVKRVMKGAVGGDEDLVDVDVDGEGAGRGAWDGVAAQGVQQVPRMGTVMGEMQDPGLRLGFSGIMVLPLS